MLLWRGFGFHWRFTSHRLPLLGSWLEDTPAPRHRFSLRIGAFPTDAAYATAHAVLVEHPDLTLLARGRTPLRVGGHISWPATATAVTTTPHRPPLGHTLVAVLDGFQIEAIGSPAGWHIGGIALAVSTDPDGAITASARMRPAESPHPGHFGLAPWDWTTDAVHSVTVGWALLAIPTDRVRRYTHRASTPHALSFSSTAWDEPHAPRTDETVLLSGFDFALDAPPWLRRRSGYLRNLNGRYLRTLRAGISRDHSADTEPTADHPAVAISNAPHPIIRAGALLLQYGMVALSVAVIALASELRYVGAIVLLALAALSRAWPSVWYEAPAVPFSVRTELHCVALGVPSRAITLQHLHTPDDDCMSVGPASPS